MQCVFFFFKQKTAYEISACLVGSEMCIRDRYQRRVHGVNGHVASWRQMIKDIREIYTGKLTAAANPSEEFAKQFWDDLDFIGVDTYYYHANKGDSLERIYEIYNNQIKALKSLGERFKKPVLITEVGQCSSGPCDRTTPCDKTDFQTQANFYEALLKIQEENTEWLKGIYFWSWNSDPAFGGEKDPCITPQYKPAEEIMRKYFGGKERLPKPDYPAECLCTV
eukprot:TRINITY_DN6261_c0_g1_i6.p3 TRINITY_DN6261_c0_g1~~TRINITY_DN6261_c0_g1_i6.p3  ORF type:complete len:223 (+),score=55.69 TRINITY_DN6261_c0_g1_i6:52-720(+)